ncbi:hypothetical protein [Pelomonas sp. Root1237]|uniref:hypothetical protein n=1 Tax=Pelomonas sp. Root1237 TaxID=1736434 RepID=UPI0012F98446|nr:hypothetical protein [Pelomonas sp. Root1237]
MGNQITKFTPQGHSVKIPSAATLIGWATVVATAISPFGPAIYEAFADDDDSFLFEYKYTKNPIVEWNRQVNAALKRLDESIKSPSDLPKSLVRSITRELAINTPTLAAWADLKPFDSLQVRITNIGSKDLKDIRVQFHGCVGYDSHATYPDSLASQESPEMLRKLADPVTISYRKLSRSSSEGSYNAYVTFFGMDSASCKPLVTADLESGKSAKGRQVKIDEYLQSKRDQRQRFERIADVSFKLGLLSMVLFLYYRIRQLNRRYRSD